MPELPAEADTPRPHPARVYDYRTGGTRDFAAGRETAARVLARPPGPRVAAREPVARKP